MKEPAFPEQLQQNMDGCSPQRLADLSMLSSAASVAKGAHTGRVEVDVWQSVPNHRSTPGSSACMHWDKFQQLCRVCDLTHEGCFPVAEVFINFDRMGSPEPRA